MDAVKHMVEVDDLSQDEPQSGDPAVTDPNQYEYLYHNLTTFLPETLDVIRQWRILLDQYPDT